MKLTDSRRQVLAYVAHEDTNVTYDFTFGWFDGIYDRPGPGRSLPRTVQSALHWLSQEDLVEIERPPTSRILTTRDAKVTITDKGLEALA